MGRASQRLIEELPTFRCTFRTTGNGAADLTLLPLTMAPMPPSDVFSLVCRMVAEVTVKNVNNGNNMPLLLLFRVVLAQRNLAFPHMLSDTVALASYMTLTYQGLKVVPVTKLLAKAFNVPVDHLDVAQRVTVRQLCFSACLW